MTQPQTARDIWAALKCGMLGRCPKCRRGRLFHGYLKISDHCPQCGIELHHHRADDAPPYFTIFLVGHLIVPWVWVIESAYRPPIWVHLTVWLPVVIVLSLLLLPAVKGAIVGMQWAMRMHGFALTPERDGGPDSRDEVAVVEIAARPR